MSSALVIGGQFPTIDALKLACQEHAVADHFETRTLRANCSQYELVCKSQDCLWGIYASSIKTTSMFEILINENAAVVFGNRRDIHVHMPWPLSLDVKKTPNFMQKRFFRQHRINQLTMGSFFILCHIYSIPRQTPTI